MSESAIDWQALRDARARGQSPVASLAAALHCPEREAAQRLADAMRLEYWETQQMSRHAPAFDLLPLARAQNLRGMLRMQA